MKIIIYLFLFISFLNAQENIYEVSIYEDNSNKIKLKDIKEKKFNLLKNNFFHKGYSKSTFWLKLNIQNNTNKDINKFFILSNFALDEIIFYDEDIIVNSGNNIKTNNYLENFYFDFILNIKKNSSDDFYFKIKSKNPISINFKIKNSYNEIDEIIFYTVISTIFFAFILAIIIYNIFLYFILKDKLYIYYLFFQITFFILLLGVNGFGYHFIWKNNADFNVFILRYLDDIFLISSLLFHYHFLNLNKYKKLSKIIFIFIVIILLSSLIRYFFTNELTKFIMLASIILIFYILIFAYKNDNKISKYYIYAWLFILFSALLIIFRNIGFVPSNLYIDWSIYIASMIEAILFSSSIAAKINENKVINKNLLEQEINKRTISLNDALNQKDILLREIHHRVKNNLQIVSSFISLGKIKISNEKNNDIDVFSGLQNRVSAISLVHEYLYKNNDLNKINMNDYIKNLVDQILIVFASENINREYYIENIKIPFDKMIILGVIINEIVTNSIKHAFKDTKNPTISFNLKKDNDKYFFEISDNGIGFENSKTNKSMGLRLIDRLVIKQLNATLNLKSKKGKTSFLISF